MPERRKPSKPARDTSAAVARRRASTKNPDPQAQTDALQEAMLYLQMAQRENLPVAQTPNGLQAVAPGARSLAEWFGLPKR